MVHPMNRIRCMDIPTTKTLIPHFLGGMIEVRCRTELGNITEEFF